MVQQVISGLEAGSWYSLVGLAIVVVMKAADVPNFAMAEMGLIAAFTGWTLHVQTGTPFVLAVLAAIALGCLVGVVVDAVVMRPLAGLGHFPMLLMTIGLSVALNALISLIWGTEPHQFPSPWTGRYFRVAGTEASWAQVVTIGVGLAAVVALTWFFRTSLGAQMRAVAENRTTARVVGVGVRRVSAIAWAIGGGLAAVALMLQAQSTVLSNGSAASVIIYSFVAATLGGFTSLWGAFAGGLVLGVLQNLAGHFVSTSAQSAVALLVVLVVLLARPEGFGTAARARDV